MYVDEFESKFCVESDKATGSKTFNNPITGLEDQDVLNLLELAFNGDDLPAWQQSSEYKSKFYKEDGYLFGDPIS